MYGFRDLVEVMSKQPGFMGSYFATQVIVKSHGRYGVQYETKVKDDGSPLEKTLTERKILPYPLTIAIDFVHEYLVDVWMDEGW